MSINSRMDKQNSGYSQMEYNTAMKWTIYNYWQKHKLISQTESWVKKARYKIVWYCMISFI